MKIINDLHQLIRDNYDKIADMPEKIGNIRKSQPSETCPAWIIIYFKGVYTKISVSRHNPQIDDVHYNLPFNEQLWTDFYNELKEVLNA